MRCSSCGRENRDDARFCDSCGERLATPYVAPDVQLAVPAHLADKIREKLLDPTRQSIYLRADEAVPWGSLTVVMDRLNLAGITNIVVVTQPLEQSKK